MRLLYVGGAGRSGSTLLELLLGNVPGYFSVGEARYFWEYWPVENRLCGCGLPLRRCSFWSAIAARLESEGIDLPQMATLAQRFDRTRRLPRLLMPGAGFPAALVAGTAALYRAIEVESEAQIIVDSSKTPTHMRLVQALDLDALTVLHLVRDGRAVAYSWSRRRKRELGVADESALMPRRALLPAMMVWTIENLAAAHFGRSAASYHALRYEDLVDDADRRLRAVLADLGMPLPARVLSSNIAPTHSVGGNPLRFGSGSLEIRRDEAWRQALSAGQRLILTLAGWPVMRRHGYRL